MILSRFYIARFAQAFGYQRRTLRLSDAAAELHLLREAETHLGCLIWEKVEGIEDLAVEYWNLRKFTKEKDLITAKLEECQIRLDSAHAQRAHLLNSAPVIQQELLDERLGLLKILDGLVQERDRIVNEAREVRRSYDGMKMKFEVLSREAYDSGEVQIAVDAVASRLAELKEQFSELKKQRLAIAEKIEIEDAKLDAVEEKLSEKKQVKRTNASKIFQVIGNGNKEISIFKAENALVETQMHQLFSDIGRYVSRNSKICPLCSSAAKEHKGLLDVMHTLRASINLNHKLANPQ